LVAYGFESHRGNKILKIMYKVKNAKILYLDRMDLNVKGLMKSNDEIEIKDLKFEVINRMLVDDVVIYKYEGGYKVLKSRY